MIKYCYYKLNRDVDFSIKADCECEDSVESIKDILIKVIVDKNKYEFKSLHAIELAKMYNWDNLAEDFHKELMKLINKD